MDAIFIISALVVGLVVGYLAAHIKGTKSQALLEAEQSARQSDRQAAEKQLADSLAQQQSNYEQQLQAAERQHADAMAQQRSSYEQQLLSLKELLNQERDGRKADKEEAKKQLDYQVEQIRKSYGEQIVLVKEQAANATAELLKARSQELQEANTTQIDALLKPLRQNIETMQKTMNDNREAMGRSTAGFEAAMKQMMERTNDIGQQADRLSNALQHKNKTTGNWGELVLTELLESQGLQSGVHFDVQETLRDNDGNALTNDETGSRMIPDVVVHLADNRDVVVDAKASLTAFVDYQNADDDAKRAEAAQRHIESVRSHVKELVGKKYQDYILPPHVSAGFTIMFIPNDGALQLVMSECPQLWRDAFEKNVFIAGSQTLVAALRIIDLAWVNVQQNRNTQRIIDEGRKLIDRVVKFHELFQKAGQKLSEATQLYHDMSEKMYDGRQSIVSAGRNLEELGVKGKKQLPEE